MSNIDFEHWWSLHLRVAKGEALSTQDSMEYKAGLAQLDEQNEENGASLAYLRALRTAVVRADMLHQELTTRSTTLSKKIAALESAYQEQTGQLLDLGPHVFA